MAKKSSIDQLSAETVRQARSELAMMQSDLNKLRDSVNGLTHGIKAPVIKPPRTRTKRTTSTSIFGEVADFAATGLLGATGLSGGYTNAAQSAGGMLAQLALGQRIR